MLIICGYICGMLDTNVVVVVVIFWGGEVLWSPNVDQGTSWELPSWVPGKLPDAPADACAACGASWTDADDAGCDLLMVGGDTGSFWFLYPFAWVGCSNNRSICCQWNNWSYLPAWLSCLLIGIQDWPRFRAASGDRSKRNSKRNRANWQLLGGLKYLLFP